jgi:Flp pilus assembly protein TadG
MNTMCRSWLSRLLGGRIWGRLGEKGAAAAEFVVILPFLLVMLSGTWDFGRALHETARLQSAARAGVQYGAQSQTTATNNAAIIAAARADANDTSNSLSIVPTRVCGCANGTTIACTSTCAGNAPPFTYVRVTVQGPYSTIVSYPFIGNPITLQRTVEMMVP